MTEEFEKTKGFGQIIAILFVVLAIVAGVGYGVIQNDLKIIPGEDRKTETEAAEQIEQDKASESVTPLNDDKEMIDETLVDASESENVALEEDVREDSRDNAPALPDDTSMQAEDTSVQIQTVSSPTDDVSQFEIDREKTEREINVLYKQGNAIGSNHYSRLYGKINDLLERGLAYEKFQALETKLQALGYSESPPADTVQNDVAEVTSDTSSPANNAEPPTEAQPAAPVVGDVVSLLPACSGQQFSVSPVPLGDLQEIYAMGNTAPPGHTLPTDHMYFHLTSPGVNNRLVSLRAPGDIYIYSVVSTPNAAMPDGFEYTISFGLCEDAFGYFGHVKKLSSEVKAAIADVDCAVWSSNPGNLCAKDIFQKFNAGDILGKVGHAQGNFDFGLYDYRKPLSYIKPTRYGNPSAQGLQRGRSLYMSCPLDYYDNDTRGKLYAKIERLEAPQCGMVMQDVLGTLQGSWFALEDPQSVGGEDQISFVIDNRFPGTSVINIGGNFMAAGRLDFAPRTDAINKRFDLVTPSNGLHCYENDGSGAYDWSTRISGSILVKLVSDYELLIEHQNKACDSYPVFNTPTRYYR